MPWQRRIGRRAGDSTGDIASNLNSSSPKTLCSLNQQLRCEDPFVHLAGEGKLDGALEPRASARAKLGSTPEPRQSDTEGRTKSMQATAGRCQFTAGHGPNLTAHMGYVPPGPIDPRAAPVSWAKVMSTSALSERRFTRCKILWICSRVIVSSCTELCRWRARLDGSS